MTPQQAIERIEFVLDSGVWPGPWTLRHRFPMEIVDKDGKYVVTDIPPSGAANANFIEACNPSSISLVLEYVRELERKVAGVEGKENTNADI